MRIDSGTLGMDSARLTKSSQSFRREVETHVSGNGTTGGQLTSTFGSFLIEEGFIETTGDFPELLEVTEGDASKENVSDDPLLSLFEMLGKQKRVVVSDNLMQERNTAAEFQKMHQKFIQDIFEFLFRKKGHKTDCEKILPNAEPRDPGTEYQFVVESTTDSFCFETMEYTTFSAQGTVHTDDGREININIDIAMSSRFCQYYSQSVTNSFYQAIDPLVVNLHDFPAGLTDIKYFFDLDADGTEDEISLLKEGSGFLALDKNGDGKINDGSELFGTASGDGFKDLALYDLDKNGWIDENDDIFDKLKVWTKDIDGTNLLYTLKDLNIGAIALQNADTEFTLATANGSGTNGYVRKTGIFLYETGETGTIQHVDLVT
ncbi:MAG: hypothetical protein J5626_04230 [Lachnospiraceae bacterium]|nr:hypothetical protein [Lachnospiraceae bacterium]